MKFKKVIAVAAVVALSASMLLSGCGRKNSETNSASAVSANTEAAADTDSSAAAETPVDNSTLTLSARCYDASEAALVSSTIEVYNGSIALTSIATDASGNFSGLMIPTGTELAFHVLDANGTEIATSNITFDISEDYESISIIPYNDTEDETATTETVQLPSGKTNILAALYIDAKGRLAIASATVNRGDAATAAPQATDQTATDQAAADQAAADQAAADQAAADQAAADQAAATDQTAAQ